METQNAAIQVLSLWNLLLVVAVWVVTQTAVKTFPALLDKASHWHKLVSLLPVSICSAAVWIPGPWLHADASVGERVVLGVVLGALTVNGHIAAKKLGLQSFLPGFMKPEKGRRPVSEIKSIDIWELPNSELDALADHIKRGFMNLCVCVVPKLGENGKCRCCGRKVES